MTPSRTVLLLAGAALAALSICGCGGEDGGGSAGTGGGAGLGGTSGGSGSGGTGAGGAGGTSASGGVAGTGASGGVAGASGAAGAAAGGAAGSGGGTCVAPALPPPTVGGLEIGGSNYVMWDASQYLADQSKWFAPLALKPVVGTYHLAPATVRSQLSEMANKGQKQISLMLWYMPISAATDQDGDGVYGHVVDSSLAKLVPQHRDNLLALLADIRCAGFNKLYFRFATQGAADASGWSAWDEAQFQQNWNFIASTRDLVDGAMNGSGVEVIYDLSAELGGITSGQAKPYTKKLWQNVTYVYGTAHTYGFSFATAPGRLSSMIGTYDETGARPPLYAFDVYGDETGTLAYISQELDAAGEKSKPVLIQETYYDDAQANAAFRSAAKSQGLKLVSIFQWPLVRGSTIQHFSMSYAADYGAYLVP